MINGQRLHRTASKFEPPHASVVIIPVSFPGGLVVEAWVVPAKARWNTQTCISPALFFLDLVGKDRGARCVSNWTRIIQNRAREECL